MLDELLYLNSDRRRGPVRSTFGETHLPLRAHAGHKYVLERTDVNPPEPPFVFRERRRQRS